MRSFLATLILCCCCGWAASATGENEPEYVMKIGLGNPETSCHYGWTPFEVLAHEIEFLSGGRLAVELYPEIMGQSSMDMIEMVRSGAVQARDFADGHFASLYPPIQVLSIPYLFRERDIAWKVLDGPLGKKLIEDMAQKTGLRPLYWIENGGFRHYSNNKKAVHSPADMQGLRFRTMESPLHIKIVTDLGAKGVPIAWSKVYDAIEAGLVDGQENSISTFMIPKLENIQSYIVLDGHVYGIYTLLMNNAWYEKLPDDLKEVINRARRISAVVNRGLAVVNEQQNIRDLKSKGVDIYKPSEEEQRMFREKTRASAIAWLREHVGEEWVQAALQATEEAERELRYR